MDYRHLCQILLALLALLLPGCITTPGKETAPLAASIGRNQALVGQTQANLKKEDALQKAQDADLQELFDSLPAQ